MNVFENMDLPHFSEHNRSQAKTHRTLFYYNILSKFSVWVAGIDSQVRVSYASCATSNAFTRIIAFCRSARAAVLALRAERKALCAAMEASEAPSRAFTAALLAF